MALVFLASVCLRRLVLATGICFGFGRVSALSVEGIANARMSDSFGIVQLVGKPGERGSTVRSARKSWKPGGRETSVFLLLARECSQGKERLTWSSMGAHGGYGVIDICSCLHRLVS